MWFRFDSYAPVKLFLIALMLVLFGCGGGGSSGSGGSSGGSPLTPSTPPSTPSAEAYTISGKVTYNSGNVAGVTVQLASSDSATVIASKVTDSTGAFIFTGVPNGSYAVSSIDTKYGFNPVTVIVNGAANDVQTIAAFPVFTVTGKISLIDGSGLAGVALNLYTTSFSIYQIDNLYGATVSLELNGMVPKITNSAGVYTFTGVRSGSYTLIPSLSGYVFNPDKSGVITITDNGHIYVYDPDKTGNSVIANIIYNSDFIITDSPIVKDFAASKPGGTGNN
jgi:hypothetical protein